MKKEQEIDGFVYCVAVKEVQKIKEYAFKLVATNANLSLIADVLKLLEIKSARIEGLLKLVGRDEISLTAKVSAKIMQPCSITLDPMIININTTITRKFLISTPKISFENISSLNLTKESFETETVYNNINLADILIETISLETPDYPKRPGASLTSENNSDTTPKNNPFAVLSKLKKNL